MFTWGFNIFNFFFILQRNSSYLQINFILDSFNYLIYFILWQRAIKMYTCSVHINKYYIEARLHFRERKKLGQRKRKAHVKKRKRNAYVVKERQGKD